MRLDRTTISLVPRTTANCLDVAVRFVGRHLREILGIWLTVALPAAVLVYLLASKVEIDIRVALAVAYLASLPLGVLLVSGAAPSLFGEPFHLERGEESLAGRVERVLRIPLDAAAAALLALLAAGFVEDEFSVHIAPPAEIRSPALVALVAVLVVRMGLMLAGRMRSNPAILPVLISGFFRRLCIGLGPALVLYPMGWYLVLLGVALCVVSCILAVRGGFIPEGAFLSRLDESLHGGRANDLLRTEGGDLFLRGCWIALFSVALAVVIFITVDFFAGIVFQVPILVGRVQQIVPPLEEVGNPIEWLFLFVRETAVFAAIDPRALAVLTGSLLLAYPIGRLAWFFCYIDVRVRRDLWDIELQFSQEARRLAV